MIFVRFGEQVPHKPGLSSYLMYLLNQKSILMVDIKNIDTEIKKAKNLNPERCDCIAYNNHSVQQCQIQLEKI